MYGRSNCGLSDLRDRGLGSGGMGESKGGSALIVSVGEACAGGELDAIVLLDSVFVPSESICSIIKVRSHPAQL